jgi:hypothetical protein
MPYEREAEAVVAMWREVERDLQAVDPESEEADLLIEQWARLRMEHQRLTALARKHRRPEPSAWPEDAERSN